MTTFGLYAAIGDPPRGERPQQCIDEVCAEAQLAGRVGREYGPAVLNAYKYCWKSASLSFRDNRSDAEFTVETMAPARIILGSPEKAVDQLQRWQEATGAEIVIWRLRQARAGGPPHEDILRAIRLFGDRVIPKLA